KAENSPAVLGPRGWSCFGTYGSSGAYLYVTPAAINPADVLKKWDGITGSGIDAATTSGETSGRFHVARIIARVFPSERSFVERVIAEGILPASEFPTGPYPSDRLAYKSDHVVEYETPARRQGLGTESALRPNADPIRGVAILQGPEVSLLQLAIRLPRNM